MGRGYTEQGGGIRTVLPRLPAPSGVPRPLALTGWPSSPLSFPSSHAVPPTAGPPQASAVHTCLVMSDSATPWTIALQAPLSTGFSRQEDWSGLPVPIPGDLPNPEIDPESHWPTRLCFSLPQQTHLTLEPVCSLIPGTGPRTG